MSSADIDALAAEISDLCIALSLPSHARQHEQLANYVQLLSRWNEHHNLTALRTTEDVLRRHLADCLAVVQPLRRQLQNVTGPRVLDVGSGGGLPGIVIATMLPSVDVSCIDKVGKKAAFIQQARGSLQLSNLRALHGRVEELKAPGYDLITARAFGSLADLVQLTAAHLVVDGCWAAMKGKQPDEEIAAVAAAADVFHVEQLHVPGLAASRCLVWMRPAPAHPTAIDA